MTAFADTSGLYALLVASLVDWVSFGVMEWEGIAEAPVLDEDFDEAGFRLTP